MTSRQGRTLLCGPSTCPYDPNFEHDNYFGCVPKNFNPRTGRAKGFPQTKRADGKHRWPGGCHAAQDREVS